MRMKEWVILAAVGMLLVGCGGSGSELQEVIVTETAAATAEPTATPVGFREGWELVWQDEFDGPEINAANWTHEMGGHGWGNAESQYYTDQPGNSFIENGHLVIQALEENILGKRYTSARMVTKGKFEQAYGRIEGRIQVPYGQGIWPAFWSLGNNFPETPWPLSGEIDIMEHIGKEPQHVYGTVHGPGYSGDSGVGGSFMLRSGALSDDFHVFAIEWEPEEIRWYIDDQHYHTITPADLPGEWVYDHPFFLILNVAVGGYWPGYPDETTVFPQQMRVDYIRVYRAI